MELYLLEDSTVKVVDLQQQLLNECEECGRGFLDKGGDYIRYQTKSSL